MLLQFPKYPQFDAIDFDMGDAPYADLDDPAGATVFLKRFCAKDSIAAVTAIEPDTGKISARSANYENIDSKLDPFIKRQCGKRNLYFSVNPVKRLVTKKTQKKDIASLGCLHVDVDPADGKDFTQERKRIRSALVGFKPKPNFIIDSGGGYQAFWRLETPLPVVDGNYEELERFNVALRDYFGADSCQNIDRIMRLPGTYNLPDKRKRAKGRVQAVSTIVHMDSGCYDPEQVIESATPASASTAEDGVPKVSVESLSVSERIKTLIRKGHDPKKYDSRSEAVFAVIIALVKAGESEGTITAVCLNPDNGISEKMLEMESGAAIKYVLGDIKRAREKAGGLFDEYVYAIRPKFFVKLATMTELDKESLDAELAVQYPLGQNTPTACKVFLNSKLGRRVDRPTYLPGGELIFTEDGETVINMARPFNLNPIEGDVQPWLDLVAHVIPDAEVREVVLDWMAYQIQHPQEKPNWAICIVGDQGIGKDFMFIPLTKILTSHNCRIITPDDLNNGWTDWLVRAKLVIVEEMATFGKKEIANRLKPLVTTPPDKVRINGKYAKQYEIPNRASFVFFSNDEEALSLEDGDRRFFVYRSSAEKQDADYYAEKYRWMQANVGVVTHHLLQRDLSNFNAKYSPPMTAAKQEMIEASRSQLVQYLTAQFKAGDSPMDRDLLTTQGIQDQLPPHLQGKATPHRIGSILRNLGGQKLTTRATLPTGKRPRVWAMRRAELYEQLTHFELGQAYQVGDSPSLAKFAGCKGGKK